MRKLKLNNRLWHERPKLKNKALRQYANQTQDSLRISAKELIMVRTNKAAYAINFIKYDARIRAEQDADRVLKHMKLKLLGQRHDEVAITSDPRYKNY